MLGKNVEVVDVNIQPNGKILMVGTLVASGRNLVIARYNSDGSLDSSFDNDGILISELSHNLVSVASQFDNKFLVAGGIDSTAITIKRYNTDGTLDVSFGDNGTIETSSVNPNGLVVEPDGKTLSIGDSSNGTTTITRYNANGTLDTNFGIAGKVEYSQWFNTYSTMSVEQDGKILALGKNNSDGSIHILKFNSDGSVDSSFNGGNPLSGNLFSSALGYNDPKSILSLQDNKIIIVADAGELNQGQWNRTIDLMKLNQNGSLDTSFGDNGFVKTSAIGGSTYATLQPDDEKIVVIGSGFSIARYNFDGSLDGTFGI